MKKMFRAHRTIPVTLAVVLSLSTIGTVSFAISDAEPQSICELGEAASRKVLGNDPAQIAIAQQLNSNALGEIYATVDASTRAGNNVVIANLKTTEICSDRPLKGQYKTRVAVASTQAYTSTITLGISGTLNVPGYGSVEITGSTTKTETVTYCGPADGTKLYNGKLATHRYVCGVLYGSVNKTTWDLVDRASHRVVESFTNYTVVAPHLAIFTGNGALDSDGTLYLDSVAPSVRRTARWKSHPNFQSSIVTNPAGYMNGYGNA